MFPEAFVPNYPLRPGDVYKHPHGNINPFILVEAVYHQPASYCLLSMGLSPNSGSFFETLHTKEEISKCLADRKMYYSHNIDQDVCNLIKKVPQNSP
jgi:hypothetical protein